MPGYTYDHARGVVKDSDGDDFLTLVDDDHDNAMFVVAALNAAVRPVRECALCCPYCGESHDRHEDAACGCGCGDEPMGCASCMREGGPPIRFDAAGNRFQQAFHNAEFDDYDDGEEWE